MIRGEFILGGVSVVSMLVDRLRNWIADWQLWSLPRRALAYVGATEALTVGAVIVTAGLRPIGATELIRLAVLAACAIAQIELARPVDRTRDGPTGISPYLDSDTVWCVTAMIALPYALADALVALIYVWGWVRVWRGRRPLYRWVFSAATVLLATQAGAALLGLGPHSFAGPAAIGFVLLAGAVRYVVNFGLIAGAIVLSRPGVRPGQLMTNLGDRLLEVGAFGLGVVSAEMLVRNPMLLAGIVAGVAATHRGLLLAQYRQAARTDVKTSLYTAGWWRELASAAFRRAIDTKVGLGVLMLDLDHFKRVNDTYGHLAGDRALRAVADTISGAIRTEDTAARWGGEEFAVLVPGVDCFELARIGERIRRRVPRLVVPLDRATAIRDLTISVGAACIADVAATEVGDLVRAADGALYAAKSNGRNQVRLAGPACIARGDPSR